MKSSSQVALSLTLLALLSTAASAQNFGGGMYGGMAPGGAYPGEVYPGEFSPGPAASGSSVLTLPFAGPVNVSATGAAGGLGYEGSYFSAGGTFPLGSDPLRGWWFIDAQAHVSEDGLPFTNVGLVRRTHFEPMGADFGLGVFYDYDGDQYEQFGHSFHQIGVNAHMYTPWLDLNFNGYVPVGDTEFRAGSADTCFYDHFILGQHGVDVALTGFDFDAGLRPPGLSSVGGVIYTGVYNYKAIDEMDDIVGFRGGFSFQPRRGVTVNLGMTTDDAFDAAGFFQVAFNFGGSRGYSPTGRDLDPVRRNDHIVRYHQDPVFLSNPDTGDLWRIVHVDNTAAEGGNGTFERPYNELRDADGTLPTVDGLARSRPGEIILVRDGVSRDRGTVLPGDPMDPTVPPDVDPPFVPIPPDRPDGPLVPTPLPSAIATTTIEGDPFDGNVDHTSDDFVGDLIGYDTGITLLPGQRLLGDGVVHSIPTRERGDFILCNDHDGLVPFIGNKNGPAITLADDTIVSGFEIARAETGILADGVTGDISIDRINIHVNDGYDSQSRTIDVNSAYGISILNSTATFTGDMINIIGRDIEIPDVEVDAATFDPATFAPDVTVNGQMVAAINVEGGAPMIDFEANIDNEIDVIGNVLDAADGTTVLLSGRIGSVSAGGRALRVADTTGGTIALDGMINNFQGEGIMIDNAANTTIRVDSMVMIDQSTTESISIMNSLMSDIDFTNQVDITNPAIAGVLLADNTDTTIDFFDLNVSTPINRALFDAGMPLTNTPVTGFKAERNTGGLITTDGKSSLDITGGPALILAGVDPFAAGDATPVDLAFNRVESRGSGDGGVNIGNTSGRIVIGKTTVLDSAGTAITVTDVNNSTTPPSTLFVEFGQTTIANTPGDANATPAVAAGEQGPGVFLRDIADATISFNTLSITTTNGAAFTAVDTDPTDGNGIVNFNAIPILNATGGAAIDVDGVTPHFQGGLGWVFNDLIVNDSAGVGVRFANLSDGQGGAVDDIPITIAGRTTINHTQAADGTLNANIASGTGIVLSDDRAIAERDRFNVTFGAVDILNRDNVGVLVDGIAGTAVFNTLNIDNNRQNAGGGFAPAAGDAVDIFNTAAAGGRVVIDGGNIDNAALHGIHIVDSNATIQNVTLRQAPPDSPGDIVDVTDPNDMVNQTWTNAIQVVTTDAFDSTVELLNNEIEYDQTFSTTTGRVGTGEGAILASHGGTGTLNLRIEDNEIRSRGFGRNDGVLIETVAGSGNMELAFNRNVINSFSDDPGRALTIDGTQGGTLFVTGFTDNVVESLNVTVGGAMVAGQSGGVFIDTVTFDADTATPAIEAVAGGSLFIDGVTGDGLVIKHATGELSFNFVDIINSGGTGLFVKNPTTDFTLNITGGEGSINTTNGAAVDIRDTAVDIKFRDVTSNVTNAALVIRSGIRLENITGTFDVHGVTAVTGVDGNGIEVVGDPNVVGDVSNVHFEVVDINTVGKNGVKVADHEGAFVIKGGEIDNTGGDAVNIVNSDALIEWLVTTAGITGNGVSAIADDGGMHNVKVQDSQLFGIGLVGVDLAVDNSSTLNANVLNNAIVAAGVSLQASVGDVGSTLNLNARGNSNGTGGSPFGAFQLLNDPPGTLRVVAVDETDLTGLNFGVPVVPDPDPIPNVTYDDTFVVPMPITP